LGLAIIKVAKPKNKYCETCEYLDSNMYYFEDTAYGCLLYGIKLFLHNNKPVRCTECIEREGKQ
jgi:hypothetical protein